MTFTNCYASAYKTKYNLNHKGYKYKIIYNSAVDSHKNNPSLVFINIVMSQKFVTKFNQSGFMKKNNRNLRPLSFIA